MISLYSLNYPALACLLILIGIVGYQLLMARREEYETALLPSSVRIDSAGKFLIEAKGDFAINCTLQVERLICRRLVIGPKGRLVAKCIEAEEILVHGAIVDADQVVCRGPVTTKGVIEAKELHAAQIILLKGSDSKIRIVPRHTVVVRKRGSHARGFFTSAQELREAQSEASSGSFRPVRKSAGSAGTMRLVRVDPKK